MPARTTRQEARARILKSFMDSLDRIIPPEGSVPLRGKTFLDWEKQADEMRRRCPTLLQERAALDDSAWGCRTAPSAWTPHSSHRESPDAR